jgi:hypothetical protein
MTQLAALKLTKAQLDQIPDDERLFYFMAGQLHNDINILSKLQIAASNELKLVYGEPPKRSAATAQVLLLLKLTAGRLYEGHKMISGTFSAKGFLRTYKSEMSSTALDSLYKLNNYFGDRSIIQRIRTKFAFHSDAGSIALAYSKAPTDFDSVEYLSNYTGHKLFHTSETLSLLAMIGDGGENWQQILDQIVGEIMDVCFMVEIFIMGFFEIIFKKHLGLTMEHLEAVTITDDPSIDDMRLPFLACRPVDTALNSFVLVLWIGGHCAR